MCTFEKNDNHQRYTAVSAYVIYHWKIMSLNSIRNLEKMLANSFWVNYNTQQIALAPTRILEFNFLLNPCNQFVNVLCIPVGGGKLKEIWIVRQTNFAKWQSKRRCCIDSLEEQKQHFLSPCHCSLAKLFFFKITPLYKYHKKTLILRGSFNFHIKVLYGITSYRMAC
jgi:hypothetical protein